LLYTIAGLTCCTLADWTCCTLSLAGLAVHYLWLDLLLPGPEHLCRPESLRGGHTVTRTRTAVAITVGGPRPPCQRSEKFTSACVAVHLAAQRTTHAHESRTPGGKGTAQQVGWGHRSPQPAPHSRHRTTPRHAVHLPAPSCVPPSCLPAPPHPAPPGEPPLKSLLAGCAAAAASLPPFLPCPPQKKGAGPSPPVSRPRSG